MMRHLAQADIMKAISAPTAVIIMDAKPEIIIFCENRSDHRSKIEISELLKIFCFIFVLFFKLIVLKSFHFCNKISIPICTR